MNKTILLADDSATIRRIVELAFTDTDFRVEAVASGGEALPLIDSLRPDLVLADVVMPEPTGYELCRTIKSSTQPVPVLLLTGTFEPFDPDLARECGADGHLVKPFESAALLERVEELLSPKPVEEPVEEPLEEAVEEPLEEELVTAIESVVSEGAEAVADEPVEIPVKVEAPDDASGFEVRLSPDEIEAIANAVVARLSDQVIREIAREVVPELAAKIVRERIQELESES